MRSALLFVLVVSLFGCSGPKNDTIVVPTDGAGGECEAIVAILRGVPGAVVTRSDGTFDDPAGGRERPGCGVTAKGTFSALRGAQRPEIRLAEALQRRGLTPDHEYDADGPDGTRFAFRAHEVLCIAQGRWDGGDDSDPTYVPEDWYEVVAACKSDPASGTR